MDFSKLSKWELVGAIGAALGALTLFILPWYSVDGDAPNRAASAGVEDWLCGVGDTSCTGWETFPILRWLLILAGAAPIILAYIIVRDHKLSYPPGEVTMVVGMIGITLIGYNGLLDKPGSGTAEIGISLDYGYIVALLVGVLIGVAGFMRSVESSGPKVRKAPGTV